MTRIGRKYHREFYTRIIIFEKGDLLGYIRFSTHEQRFFILNLINTDDWNTANEYFGY